MPFKADQVEATLKSAKKVLNVECNYSSQMARMVRAETGFDIKDKFAKYDGEPIYVYEIVNKAKQLVVN